MRAWYVTCPFYNVSGTSLVTLFPLYFTVLYPLHPTLPTTIRICTPLYTTVPFYTPLYLTVPHCISLYQVDLPPTMDTIAEEPSGGEDSTSNEGSDHNQAGNVSSGNIQLQVSILPSSCIDKLLHISSCLPPSSV